MREIVCSRTLWSDIALASSVSTYFHGPQWADTLVEVFPGFRLRPRAFRFEDGTTAVLPLIETDRPFGGLFRRLESMPLWAYGGPIADSVLDASRYEELLTALTGDRRLMELRVVGNPFGKEAAPGSFKYTDDFTHCLYLEGRSAYSSSLRYDLRRATKSGVTVRWTCDISELRQYNEVRTDALHRWGRREEDLYPPRLLAACLKRGEGSSRLWLAERNGELLAGAMVFEWQRYAVYWHGASVTSGLEHRPSHALQAAIISDLAERGFRLYDFNPSGGNTGVAKFKASFGAVMLPFKRWAWDSPYMTRARRWRARIKGAALPSVGDGEASHEEGREL